MMGEVDSVEERGLIPNAVSDLFASVEEETNKVSMASLLHSFT